MVHFSCHYKYTVSGGICLIEFLFIYSTQGLIVNAFLGFMRALVIMHFSSAWASSTESKKKNEKGKAKEKEM